MGILDGYFDDDRFIMRGINGNAVYGIYTAENIRSLAFLIEGREPITIIVDNKRKIQIPIEVFVGGNIKARPKSRAKFLV